MEYTQLVRLAGGNMLKPATTSALMIGLMALPGCISASEYDRGTAYSACRDATDVGACVEQRMADSREDRSAYAEAYQRQLEDCERRRVHAAAAGAGTDAVKKKKNVVDYVAVGAFD